MIFRALQPRQLRYASVQMVEKARNAQGAPMSRADQRDDVHVRQRPFVEHGDQSARMQMFGDIPFGARNNAEPGKRLVAYGAAVVAGQKRLDPDTLRRRAMVFRRKAPQRYVLVVFAQGDAVVRTQLLWM